MPRLRYWPASDWKISHARPVRPGHVHVLLAEHDLLAEHSDLGYADVAFAYGAAGAGWIPLAGDWDGNGTETIGLYNPATSTFYLRNTTSLQGPNDKGYADVTFTFGAGRGRLDPHRRRLEWRRQGHHRPVQPSHVHVLLAEHDLLAGPER